MSTPPPPGTNPYSQPPAPGANPYSQPAPGGNPYSQPPQAPYGAPGGNPYGGPGAPAPVRRVSVKGVFRGIVGVLLAGFLLYGGYSIWFGGASTADAGDCLHAGNATATGPISVGDPKFEIVDCGDSQAQFKVVDRQSGMNGSCDDQYKTYTQGGSGRDFTLCLEPLK
ncbi:hypothetical protein [Streptomyces sp. NPDC026673]|uniref:LppU/SCO3897 family protein n=1 Tax=Streptomyces sp. NPDC026673 TaxID=3155724 RepID=UPI0033FDF2AC